MGLMGVWCAWERLGLPRGQRVRPGREVRVARLVRPSADELLPYVLRNQPVVISGALDEEGFPPVRDFTDFAYLRSRCGDRVVKVKGELFLDRHSHKIYVSDPSVEMTFSEYLSFVENAETTGVMTGGYLGKAPLASSLPELAEDVEAAIASPFQQFKKCFGQNDRGVHTYFGCGRNTTAIHYDMHENLLAVLSGTKSFDLYPPTDADVLYPTTPPAYLHSAVPPFTCPHGMPKDLAESWPLYRHAQPLRVDLKAGDVLYLPIFWWHAVTGGKNRNMILNWWCDMHPTKAEPTANREGARYLMEQLLLQTQ